MAKSKTEIIITSSGNYGEISKTALKLQDLVTHEIFERVTWLRAFLPTIKLNPTLIIRAEILEHIIGDDLNCFGFDFDSHTPEMLELGKHNILTRMQMEIDTLETPSIIRAQLKKTLNSISQSNWMNEKEYAKVKKEWLTNVRDFTVQKINHYAPFDEAINYARAHEDQIKESWRTYASQFVGKKLFQ